MKSHWHLSANILNACVFEIYVEEYATSTKLILFFKLYIYLNENKPIIAIKWINSIYLSFISVPKTNNILIKLIFDLDQRIINLSTQVSAVLFSFSHSLLLSSLSPLACICLFTHSYIEIYIIYTVFMYLGYNETKNKTDNTWNFRFR